SCFYADRGGRTYMGFAAFVALSFRTKLLIHIGQLKIEDSHPVIVYRGRDDLPVQIAGHVGRQGIYHYIPRIGLTGFLNLNGRIHGFTGNRVPTYQQAVERVDDTEVCNEVALTDIQW